MIRLYSGTPGSGKSYHIAADLVHGLTESGKLFIANFPITQPKHSHGNFLYVDNADLTPAKLVEISRSWFLNHRFGEGQIVLYLDECQLMFNAREWQKTGRDTWLSFFTQHRKYGYDIILVAQFDRMVDRQIRSLIEEEQLHRKLSNVGWQGKVANAVMGGHMFARVIYYYPLHERTAGYIYKMRKSVFKIYDTYGDFKVSKEKIAAEDQAAEIFAAQHNPDFLTLIRNTYIERVFPVLANGGQDENFMGGLIVADIGLILLAVVLGLFMGVGWL